MLINAFIEDENPVAVTDGGEPVRDQDHGDSAFPDLVHDGFSTMVSLFMSAPAGDPGIPADRHTRIVRTFCSSRCW